MICQGNLVFSLGIQWSIFVSQDRLISASYVPFLAFSHTPPRIYSRPYVSPWGYRRSTYPDHYFDIDFHKDLASPPFFHF